MIGYILEHVEDAFNNYLTSSYTGSVSMSFYQGMDYLTKAEPLVVSYAMNAEPVEGLENAGVYAVGVKVYYKYAVAELSSSFSSSLVNRKQGLNDLSNVLLGNADLPTALMGSTTNLQVHHLQFDGVSNVVDGDCWVGEFDFTCVCGQS